MPIVSRRWSVAAAVVAGLALLLVVLSFAEFDATRLGRAVLEQAGAVTGAKLTARAFRLRPITGLVLEDVEAAASFTGGNAAVTIDRLVLDHRLRRLLVGEVAVDRLVLRRPHIRLTETQASRPAPKTPPGSSAAASVAGLALRVSRIDVEDGTIELQAPGQPRPVVVKGLELRLRDVALEPGRTPVLSALSGVGDVRVAEVVSALGYTDCTARGPAPCRLRLPSGAVLPELPTTHSIGALARGVAGRLGGWVHAYFHDYDLLDPRRRATLVTALALLGLRREEAGWRAEGPELAFSEAFGR